MFKLTFLAIVNHDLNCQKDHNKMDEIMTADHLKKIALLVDCKNKPITINKKTGA